MKNICVIGAGTMGNGIAHVFAQNGFSVSLVDVSQDQLNKAMATINKNLDRQVAKGAIPAEIKEKNPGRHHYQYLAGIRRVRCGTCGRSSNGKHGT